MPHVVCPVSEKAFHAFSQGAQSTFSKVVESVAPEWRDLLLADYRFLLILIQVVHAKAVVQGLEEYGAPWTPPEQFSNPQWDQLAVANRSIRARPPVFSAALREARRRYVYNDGLGIKGRIFSVLRPPDVWSVGSNHALKREYVEANQLGFDMPVIERFATAAVQEPPNSVRKVLEEMVRLVVSSGEALTGGGISVCIDEIVVAWSARLADLTPLYFGLSGIRQKPSILLVGSPGDPIVRVVCLALRRQGVRVMVFLHAHNVGYTCEVDRSLVDICIGTEFMAPTIRAARSLERLAKKEYLTQGLDIQFLSTESGYYRQKIEQVHPTRMRKDRMRVVVTGFAFNGYRYTYGVGLYDPIRREMEARLLRELRSRGFYVVYKPHPSTLDMAWELFGDDVDEFEVRPFDQMIHEADVLLFTYPLTTALGEAVVTDRPIVLLDIEDPDWNEEVRESLATRCVFIPAAIDDTCQVHFDADQLEAGIRAAAARPVDHQYVRDFLIPQAP